MLQDVYKLGAASRSSDEVQQWTAASTQSRLTGVRVSNTGPGSSRRADLYAVFDSRQQHLGWLGAGQGKLFVEYK
jgi:hypothetical protein